MQQKEVLIIVGGLVVGFFLLNNNAFSGQAITTDNSDNIVSFPQGYGTGASSYPQYEPTGVSQEPGPGLATEQCPPPRLFEKDCHTSSPPVANDPNDPYGRGGCNPTRIACLNCLSNACRDFTSQCSHYCGLDQPGAPRCWPQTDCRRYGCYDVSDRETEMCAYDGNAVAMCACTPIETTTQL